MGLLYYLVRIGLPAVMSGGLVAAVCAAKVSMENPMDEVATKRGAIRVPAMLAYETSCVSSLLALHEIGWLTESELSDTMHECEVVNAAEAAFMDPRFNDRREALVKFGLSRCTAVRENLLVRLVRNGAVRDDGSFVNEAVDMEMKTIMTYISDKETNIANSMGLPLR